MAHVYRNRKNSNSTYESIAHFHYITREYRRATCITHSILAHAFVICITHTQRSAFLRLFHFLFTVIACVLHRRWTKPLHVPYISPLSSPCFFPYQIFSYSPLSSSDVPLHSMWKAIINSPRSEFVAGEQTCRRPVRRSTRRPQPHLPAGSALRRAPCEYLLLAKFSKQSF